jgi:hypothetical protein
MESEIDIINKSLGKSLKTDIKYVVIVSIRFYKIDNKEGFPTLPNGTTSSTGTQFDKSTWKKILFISKEKIYILSEDMSRIIEQFRYENIKEIELDNKNSELATIYLRDQLKNTKGMRFTVTCKYRGIFIKNLMCYYSVYFMHNFFSVKNLTVYTSADPIENKLKAAKLKGLSSKYKLITQKSYDFFIKYSIKDNYMNKAFKIQYGGDEKQHEQYFSSNCDFSIEISEKEPMGKFDVQKDDRDLSFYAYNNFLIYMRNTAKTNRFWITKNKIYHKKYNLSEDSSQWEGWQIEARASEPSCKNIIIIYLRRKFIPPYWDTFQNFSFILSEECSRDKFKINPCAYEVIELAANSIHVPMSISGKDFQIFLKAKVDSLLVDEESLSFYQNSQQIIGKDVHKFGFEFLYSVLVYLEVAGNLKEKVQPIRQYIDAKVKSYADADLDVEL